MMGAIRNSHAPNAGTMPPDLVGRAEATEAHENKFDPFMSRIMPRSTPPKR